MRMALGSSAAVGHAAVAMLCLLAFAMGAAAQGKDPSFADGDILKILAFGREDLTGQYSVQAGGVISLPLIGAVELVNRTPRQLEEFLSEAWENRVGAPMSVTVDFVERAPFYVLGAVNSPGAYPYRPGLTALQAVAVSGGVEKLAANDARFRIDVLRERERREQAIERMARAAATRARLLAEREGKSEIAFPDDFSLAGRERMEALISEETKLLLARRHQSVLKEALLREQVDLGEDEISSYQQQIDALSAQERATAAELGRIRRLPGQQNRIFDLDQRISNLAGSKVAAVGNLARAKSSVAAARNEIAAVHEARLQEITEMLAQSEQTYQEGHLTERAAAEILQGVGLEPAEETLEFRLLKPNGSNTDYEVVGPTTPVRPGDILDVWLGSVHLDRTDNASPAGGRGKIAESAEPMRLKPNGASARRDDVKASQGSGR